MSDAPDKIWLQVGDDQFSTYTKALEDGADISWCQEPVFEYDIEYIRADLYYELETKCDNWLDSLKLANVELAELQAENERIKRSAVCYVSHNIKWLGEEVAPGWCLGCGRHRSLIREEKESD